MDLSIENISVSGDDVEVELELSSDSDTVTLSVSDILRECPDTTLLAECDPDEIRQWCKDHDITLEDSAPTDEAMRERMTTFLDNQDDLIQTLAVIVGKLYNLRREKP